VSSSVDAARMVSDTGGGGGGAVSGAAPVSLGLDSSTAVVGAAVVVGMGILDALESLETLSMLVAVCPSCVERFAVGASCGRGGDSWGALVLG